MKTITLDEISKLPPLTEAEIEEIKNFRNTDFSDCPLQTKEELAQFRPWYEAHQDCYRPTKTAVNIRIDSDVLSWFKSQGKGYQSKINAVLRAFVLNQKTL